MAALTWTQEAHSFASASRNYRETIKSHLCSVIRDLPRNPYRSWHYVARDKVAWDVESYDDAL